MIAQQLLNVIPMAMRVLRSEFRAQAKPCLTVPQFRVLIHLSQGECNNNQLAEDLGVSVAAMSRMVFGLSKRGFIERTEHADDRRQIRLTLTAAGRTTVESLKHAVQESMARKIARLKPGPRRALVDGLRVLEELMQ